MALYPDLASSAFRIPKLLAVSPDDDGKLQVWKARVRPFLEAYDLWSYVSAGTTPCPLPTNSMLSSDGETSYVPDPESDERRRTDQVVKDWLLSTISDELIPLKNELQLLPTSKEIWDRLEEAISTVHRAIQDDDEADHVAKERKDASRSGTKRTSSQYKSVTDDGLIIANEEGSYIISARKLEIYMLQEYWDWFWVPGLRFSEVVRLVEGPQTHIRITGKIGGVDMLIPDTSYVVNLIYKLTTGSVVHSQSPFLFAFVWEDPFDRDECKSTVVSLRHPPVESEEEAIKEYDVETPRVRDDGWLEVTLGLFAATTMHVQAGADYVEVNLTGTENFPEVPYEDIIIEGMEFKPIKNVS